MSRTGASVTTVFPDKQRFPSKIKRKKISETLIRGKKSIQEPENPSKRAKQGSITDEKIIIIKHPQKKGSYVWEPLTKFWIFASVGETD